MVFDMDLGSVFEFTFWDFVSVAAILFVAYRFVKKRWAGPEQTGPPPVPQLPPMAKQDMTVNELREFDGESREDGRILLACDNKVFDVTNGRRMYGKDGPYHVFAGRDASRGMATFDSTAAVLRDEYDDLSDLGAGEKAEMKEWASNLSMRYPIVGKLLAPDEKATEYEEGEVAKIQYTM